MFTLNVNKCWRWDKNKKLCIF